jgi:hypothetical protein
MRRHAPRVSPSWTRVFGPIAAMIRDWRVGSDRTTAQLRATDVTQPPRVFARAVALGAGAGARAGAARGAGARAGTFAITGGRVVAGAVARDRERAGAVYAVGDVDDEATGALASVREAAFSGGRSATGGGTGSACTTVPADCMDTGSLGTTGVDTAGSVSTVARAIAVS